MLSLVIVLALGIFAQQAFADEPEAIVGGTPASPGELPYQCSLRVQGSHVCGGTIISPRCVVTAAHCLKGVIPPPYTSVRVVTGGINSRGGQQRRVSRAAIHPNYVGEQKYSWMNDAAVLVLDQPIQFNQYQSALKLATYTPRSGTQCLVSGWGKTSTTSSVSPNLLKAFTTTIDSNSCQNSHRGQPIYNSHLCTFAQYGRGACQGDSGGPLRCNNELSGIVSWVMPCGIGYPDVFCDIAAVRGFIQSNCPDTV